MVETLTDKQIKELVEAARKVRNMAYAPYSDFLVGAAALGVDGKIYTGCNVENVSYGLTICAERTAVFKSVSEGNKGFRALAIYAETERYCAPCGACRQVIAEFGRGTVVIQVNKHGGYIQNTIEELLPAGFMADNLERGL